MKWKSLTFQLPIIWLFALLIPTNLQAQATGTIRDRASNEPLIGATILIKSTGTGTVSDAYGQFTINARPGDTLLFSYLGYKSEERVVPPDLVISVSLDLGVNLQEVVVVGYGTQQRKDITGSASKVNAMEFDAGQPGNPLQQIQGKVAGLVIVQPGGDPNGELTVRLRGAASLEGQPPLLVIDGVAIEDFQRAITTLNPADVESYDILKDASAAAIYGSRGANGVILVTTKSGSTGKTQVEYDGNVGVERVSKFLDLLTAAEWREATAATGSGLDKGGNVDWQRAVARTAWSHNHTLGISGGVEKINFRGSFGYNNLEGAIRGTGKEVITTRLSATQRSLNNRLEIRYGVNTALTNRNFLPDQDATSQSRIGGSKYFGGVLLNYLPVWPVRRPDGSYYQSADQGPNPMFVLNEVYSEQKENFFQTSVQADYELKAGFKVGVLGALSRTNDLYDLFLPAIPEIGYGSSAVKRNFNRKNFTGDYHANYRKKFNRHGVELTGVYEYNKFLNDGFGVEARGFLIPELLNNNLGANTDIRNNDVFSYKNEVKLISFLGRFNYNFDDRYLLTVNFRRDGSSKFGINNRWGNFPSVAMAWRANNEKWLQDVQWLSELKLRASYGLTGNQENITPYPYQLLYGPVGPYYYNNQVYQSYGISQENNPDLKWEVRKSFNLGIDFSVFEDRLNGTFDYFYDKTEDMLFRYELPQPPFLTNSVTANAANALNTGFEATVNATLLKKTDFRWEVHFNLGSLKNKILNLSGKFKGYDLTLDHVNYGYAEGRGLSGAYISELQAGYPAGVFWLPEHAGLDDQGRELFNNYDEAGNFTGVSTTYTDLERVFIDPTPDFTWGFTSNLSFENFDFNFFFRGVQGQKVFANSLMVMETVTRLPASNVTKKALTNGFTAQPQPSTYWLRDASFARLENLNIGYRFKKDGTWRVYFVARNLFVLTKYEGLDPEIKTEGSQRYVDTNYYPKTRSIALGFHFQF